jgi:hypothetical protein
MKLEKARGNLIRFADWTASTFGPHELAAFFFVYAFLSIRNGSLAFFSFGRRTFATAQSSKKEEGRNDGEQTESDHDLIPE